MIPIHLVSSDLLALSLVLTFVVGAAIEVLTGFVTAPSTTLTNLTMATGNTLTVRGVDASKQCKLISAWADNQAAGVLDVRSPRMHDNVVGWQSRVVASVVQPLYPFGFQQRLYPQDTLTVQLSGSAVAADIETASLLLYYEDVPGASGRFISPADMRARAVNIIGVQNTLALGTAGGYSGSQAINTTNDQFKANTDYAMLGYVVNVECATVRWSCVDFGNLGLGGPGCEDIKDVTVNWWERLSIACNLPLIPVFNAANKNNFLIDGAQDENGDDVIVMTYFVELAMR
jgi:hypothetical protein